MPETDINVFGVFIGSLGQVLQWKTFQLMLVGMAIGFAVGILPGLGGGTTLALMLPFTFTMEPLTAFAFLLGMRSVTATTGDITSVLFGVPGEGTSAATVFDGYPMTKNGEAGRALGIVLFSSAVGAIVGAFFMALAIPFIRPIVLSFGPPEFFMLAMLGLSYVSGLSGESIRKGLIMAGFGLILSAIGQDPGTARLRFTFGETYLFDGLSLVPVAIGLFAVPSIIEMMAQKTSVARQGVSNVSGSFQGIVDTFRNWWLLVRCSAIGIFIGVVPGIGGGAAQFIAYAHAQQTSKEPEKFGKGSVEGVLAAGTVNNAKEGGDLLPTVAFGVPGSSGMAILLGAFLITGLTPGPKMLTEHLDVTFSMVWTIVVANIITVAVCFLFLKQIARITFVRGTLLVPFLVVFVGLGAYTANNQWLDIVAMLGFGVLAYFATIWGWPLPPLLLGLVLGRTVETNFFLSYSLANQTYVWLTRPIVLVLAAITALGLFWPLISSVRTRLAARNRAGGTVYEQVTHFLSRWRLALSLLLLVIAVMAIYQMQFGPATFPLRAKQFPLVVAVPMLVLAIWQVLVDLWGRTKVLRPVGPTGGGGAALMEEADAPKAMPIRDVLIAAAQFGSFFVAIWTLGFLVGLPLATFLYLLLVSREKWWAAAIGAVLSLGFIYLLFVRLLPIPLMQGEVFKLLNITFP